MKLAFQETRIACRPVSALVWDGNDLVDVQNGLRLHLDGTVSDRSYSLCYPFDRAVGIRQADVFWAVACANRHTKAILLKNGNIHRELNRSYYFANAYDYPVTVAATHQGRVVVVHCPNSFDTLEVEDADTGESLATIKTKEIEFHSRLSVSGDGRYLLDAGWFWHPINGAWLCDFEAHLGGEARSKTGIGFSFGAEIDSAAFLGNDRVVVTSTSQIFNDDIPANGLGPNQIGVWSISDERWLSTAALAEPSGSIMPWRDWAISLYGHPKAIHLATGEVVQRWEHIESGKQRGPIELGEPPPPPMALDSQNGRFAIAGPSGITVVQLLSD